MFDKVSLPQLNPSRKHISVKTWQQHIFNGMYLYTIDMSHTVYIIAALTPYEEPVTLLTKLFHLKSCDCMTSILLDG